MLVNRIVEVWTRSRTGRLWEIDALRGVAVVMMVVYHFMYDLYYFQVSDAIFSMRFWFYFQRATASTFILLVGLSVAIAAQRSSAYDQPAWARFRRQLRRGAGVLAWGLVITLATWLVMGPRLAITFGILHFIGVAIVMAYPFARFRWLNLALGIALLGVGKILQRFTFDLPWLVWLGFEPTGHVYVDYFPFIPWFGVVLIGIFLGNTLYRDRERRLPIPDLSSWPPLGWLRWLGSRSMPIYLVHQPALFALLIPILFLIGRL